MTILRLDLETESISETVRRILAENAENHHYMRTSLGIFAKPKRTDHVSQQTSAFAPREKEATL